MVETLCFHLPVSAIGRVGAFEAVRDAANPVSASVFLHWPRHQRPPQTQPLARRETSMRPFPFATVSTVAVEATDAEVQLEIEGRHSAVPLVSPQLDLFSDLKVLAGQRNGEPVSAVVDWISWHVRHHGVEAVLLLERDTPAQLEKLGSDLKKRLKKAPGLNSLKRVVLIGADHPLGLAHEGPESDPIYAPDSPGKDRMTAPDPDPWASRLGFPVLYSMLGERFLRAAKGVLRLDVLELLAPPENGTVFDQLDLSAAGYISLTGQRCFPWGLSPKAETISHWDHVCTRFDSSDLARSWCIAPKRLPADAIWMPHRILKAAEDTARRAHFWRFMALRTAERKVSQIVPRTSLKEDPALIKIAEDQGYTPRRMPEEAVSEEGLLPIRKVTGRRTVVVTTMKNEAPFILEWLAYHRAIGVSDVLVYTNDCTDGTDSFLQLLAKKGYVQWRDNPYRASKMKPQHAALEVANSDPAIADADWVICMDVDEYIAVHVGDGTLADLYDAVPDANLISLTWRLFGNANTHEFRDEFITQRYTQAALEFANKPHQAWGFKTLFKNVGLFRKIGVHRPKGLRPHSHDKISWVTGSGKPMPVAEWRTAWRSTSGTYGYDLVSLNHYAVRSAESFLVKRDRGRVNHVDRDQGSAYWFRMNHNVVQDERMRKMLPRLQAEYDRLMADEEIAAAHHAGVAAHRDKIKELKAQPNYAAFYSELTGPRMEKLSSLHGHFGANVYLAGPSCIPDEIVERDKTDDFFFTVEYDGDTQH